MVRRCSLIIPPKSPLSIMKAQIGAPRGGFVYIMELQEVSAQEAAHTLGVSEDTVIRHIKQGKLTGHKREGRWVCLVEAGPGPPKSARADSSGEVVRILEEQVTFLRGQLEASRQAESELRRLIVHMDPGPARRKSLPERVGEWFRGTPND